MSLSRRTFLATPAGFGMAAGGQAFAANDHIQIATIGLGRRGLSDSQLALTIPGVQIVGACDLYTGSLLHAKEIWGESFFTTRDYREILSRKDVDAVIIATPDHWHARIAIDALKAGKDVYLETPMIHDIDQGRPLIEAQQETGRILQIGSQFTSSIEYQKARDILRSAAIGKLTLVEAFVDRNTSLGATRYSIPPDASPETCDWDRFLGSAPKRPFDKVRFFWWRHYWDYGTGQAGDLYVHLLTSIHFMLDSLGPVRVTSTGGVRFWKDGREVPDVFLALYDFPQSDHHPEFNAILRLNYASGCKTDTLGFRFYGSEGVLTIQDGVSLTKTPREARPGYTVGGFPKAVRERFLAEYHRKYPDAPVSVESMRPEEEIVYKAPPAYNLVLHHIQNFFESVRNRKRPVQDAVFGLRAAGPALLANKSYLDHEICRWDPTNMAPAM